MSSNAPQVEASIEVSHDTRTEAAKADGIEELEEFLAKFDDPELSSIRHLFNMC